MFTMYITRLERKGRLASRRDREPCVLARLSRLACLSAFLMTAAALAPWHTATAYLSASHTYEWNKEISEKYSTPWSNDRSQPMLSMAGHAFNHHNMNEWSAYLGQLNRTVSTLALVFVDPPAKKPSAKQQQTAIPVSSAQLSFTDTNLAPQQQQVLKSVKVVATGYTAGVESTGKKPGHPEYGITYSGVKVRRDYVSTIAADLSVFPLGSILYIPGYGYGIVSDIGSKIKGKKIDLYFDTTKQVYSQWGKKEVEVQLIKQGNGKLSEKTLTELNEAVFKNGNIPKSML